jgi:hypothetical protein
VDTAAELRAIKKLLNKEVHKASDSKKSFLYHMREKPVNEELFPSLNE